MLISIIIS